MAGAIIVGAGPGIGQSVAQRFAAEGLPVAVLARSAETLATVSKAVPAALPLVADATDETALRTALDQATAELGGPADVVVYNAALIRPDTIATPARAHLDAWAVNVVGAVTTAAHVLPAMAERGSGTFLVTSGMPEPKPDYVSLSLGKAGVRALATLLDTQYGPSGIHVATITVAGPVAPGTAFDPDDIATHYWRLHTQPRDAWEHEVLHGPA